MLKLIGIGLRDEKDVSLRAIEEARECERVFLETYTNPWKGSIGRLEETIGRKIEHLGREEVESDFLVGLAESSDIALLVPGDPLSATTHMSLVTDARRKGIKVRIVHSSSIFTAIAETGLHLYKFGRTATIPKPSKGYRPMSFAQAVEQNRKSGLHTLLLVDTAEGMDAETAMELMEEAGIGEAIAVADVGGEGVIRKWKKGERFSLPRPFCFVVPGELHFSEREFLELLEEGR